jgi:hypothetical protein
MLDTSTVTGETTLAWVRRAGQDRLSHAMVPSGV